MPTATAENTATPSQPAGTAVSLPTVPAAAQAPRAEPTAVPIRGSLPRLVRVNPGDTLAEMAARVYGRQTYTLLDLLGEVNPTVHDPSRIIAGAVLLFPSLDAQTRIIIAEGGAFQVIARTTPSLREALATQKRLQTRMSRPVEIRTLSLKDGPDLYRVFLRTFASADEASRAAHALGPVLRK